MMRIRPWTAILTIASDAGRLWFKANGPSMAFEAALVPVLGELAPDIVSSPVAVDVERGWLLHHEHSGALAEKREPTQGDWITAVRLAARLQQRCATHREAVLTTDVLDASLDTVLSRFDRLKTLMADLLEPHPAALSGQEICELIDARPHLEAAVAVLADSPFPQSVQHGDLHPFNLEADSPRIFDFGDAQWAACFESLCVPRDWIAAQGRHDWEPVFEAYLAEWAGAGLSTDRESAEGFLAAATLTHAVNRAATWWNCLADATAAEWSEWGQAPRRHLLNVARSAR